MAKQRPYDPLDCIPSVEVIEQRLKDVEMKARKLRVLLSTARKIERQTESSATTGAADE
ncbi:MAG TPA: hypothetical protein VGM98_21695 [Schlesneria sp.]